MSLMQLQYFVAVADREHVGRAAKALRLAQPALSRQIRNLEDELGTQLFERHPRGMRLSPSGHRLLPRARAILAQVEEATQALGSAPPHDASSHCPETKTKELGEPEGSPSDGRGERI